MAVMLCEGCEGHPDGVLLRTPDDKWHLIDGGNSGERQAFRKSATNFLYWKFIQDLGRDAIELENVILTHPDLDHYGGLIDLFNGRLLPIGSLPERTFELRVENFYHDGLGRFAEAPRLGSTRHGTVEPFPLGAHGLRESGTFITELLDDKADFASPPRPFEGDFAKLAAHVATKPRKVGRLSSTDGYLPGYAPADASGCTIRVLGPVLETLLDGAFGLRELGSDSVTRNGHSIVLRVDYGNARILLTGDLNTQSQRLLLSYLPEGELAVDVAKGCHHGSDDVDLGFVRALAARATVISSGDNESNESYAHPRPRILGASARYGREGVDQNGRLVPPLIYSTELARSIRHDFARTFKLKDDKSETPESIRTRLLEWDPPGPKYGPRRIDSTGLAVDIVYGLVKVRTDGREILMATLEESSNDFDYRVIQAGVSPSSP